MDTKNWAGYAELFLPDTVFDASEAFCAPDDAADPQCLAARWPHRADARLGPLPRDLQPPRQTLAHPDAEDHAAAGGADATLSGIPTQLLANMPVMQMTVATCPSALVARPRSRMMARSGLLAETRSDSISKLMRSRSPA
jgi:hypothetical protein